MSFPTRPKRFSGFFSLLAIVYGLMIALIPPFAVMDTDVPYTLMLEATCWLLAIPASMSAALFLVLEALIWYDERKEASRPALADE